MQVWKPRQGTNLNKFTKSGETTTEVVLTNDPDAITQAGTPFTSDNMNNIEKGIYDSAGIASEAKGTQTPYFRTVLAQSLRYIAVSPVNGDVYACGEFSGAYTTNIYKQSKGVGSFTGLGVTARKWRGIHVTKDGHVYATEAEGDVYLSTDGTTFTALGQTTRDWRSITSALDGNIYISVDAVTPSEDCLIYKRTAGAGNFVSTGISALNVSALAYDHFNNDIYAACAGYGIYKQTNCSGSFVDTGFFTSEIFLNDVYLAPNNDMYVLIGTDSGNNYIYKKKYSESSFSSMFTETNLYHYTGICANPQGLVYVSGQDMPISVLSSAVVPSAILEDEITATDNICYDPTFSNIKLTGTFTEASNYIFPNDLRKYKVINSNAYPVTLKTASGAGVLIITGQTLDVYCDGTNIKTNGVNLGTTETITNDYFMGYPVYAKVVNFGALPNNTTKNVAHSISGTYTIMHIFSTPFNSSGLYLNLNHVDPSSISQAVEIFVDSTNVTIKTAADFSTFTKCYVTLKYIKAAL